MSVGSRAAARATRTRRQHPGRGRPAALLLAFCALSPLLGQAAEDAPDLSIDRQEPAPGEYLLSNIRQLTYVGRRSKEAYFSSDGSRLVFQSERESGNPFYQTYVLDLTTGRVVHVSSGIGRTERAFFHPNGRDVIFASTHADADVRAEQTEELRERAGGDPDRFVWDYDADLDLYLVDLASGRERRLTETYGYDAEAVISPDGRWIVFASNRKAYASELGYEDEERLAIDASYFIDLYRMRSDGSDVEQLTDRRGYDGGPVFSRNGQRVAWRRFNPENGTAEIHTMAPDGSDVRRLSDLEQTSWAPFYHPSGDYLIFSSNQHGLGNYELYVIDAKGDRAPARVTQAGGYDGLPAFSPDGRRLSWTGRHAESMLSQIFVADWNDAEARRRLGLAQVASLRPLGPAQIRAEKSDQEAPAPAEGQSVDIDPGGIEDPTQQAWTGRHMFSLTRGLSRSPLGPLVRTPLYLVTVPADIILLPVTALVGFIE